MTAAVVNATAFTNEHFPRLLAQLKTMGDRAHFDSEQSELYLQFIEQFPLHSLPNLTLEQYCVGKGDGNSFCWWIEHGLQPVLARYMPGTSRGHLIYFLGDGSVYKNKRLADLSDEEALRYTLKVQHCVAAADPDGDLSWIDDDQEIYRRAGVDARVTMSNGRKLRLVTCYQPSRMLPISSPGHLGHFLNVLGWPSDDIPPENQSIGRMQRLMRYYELARESLPELTPYGFMKGLYDESLGLAPPKADKDDSGSDDEDDTMSEANDTPVMPKTNAPLNQILFGPPGTGKTYHTINKALAILDPECLAQHDDDVSPEARKALKARFDELVKEGRIDFVTFHQSFSYEDFVEGIRAESREDGGLDYKVEQGVFATLCERARRGGVVVVDAPFEQALQELVEQANQTEDGWVPMRTALGKRFKARYFPDKGTFAIDQESRQGDRNHDSANMKYVRALYETGEKGGYSTSYVQGMLDYLKAHCGLALSVDGERHRERKPFVLVIDEINRGNVSRIFGELITLIEPSKRAGASEALTTTLPYSKRPFSVPDNLYLIGTMNTADRSLAGLDIALRRRFVFEEMPPRADLLDGVVIEEEGYKVDVGRLLHTLNQRIEVLLDRDHCLGHAYFMPLKAAVKPTMAQLASIFQHQVLPLLQEYFFEDWQRIAWVLNDHRKSKAEAMFLEAPKLELKTLLGDVVVGGQRQRWSINEKAFTRIEAYVLTIEGDKGGQ
ncbi:McrB family protein [Aeromonas veronii]